MAVLTIGSIVAVVVATIQLIEPSPWLRLPPPTVGLALLKLVLLPGLRRAARPADLDRRWTDPHRVIGATPAAFIRWVFGLLAAHPGDTLDDLFPGSGSIRLPDGLIYLGAGVVLSELEVTARMWMRRRCGMMQAITEWTLQRLRVFLRVEWPIETAEVDSWFARVDPRPGGEGHDLTRPFAQTDRDRVEGVYWFAVYGSDEDVRSAHVALRSVVTEVLGPPQAVETTPHGEASAHWEADGTRVEAYAHSGRQPFERDDRSSLPTLQVQIRKI